MLAVAGPAHALIMPHPRESSCPLVCKCLGAVLSKGATRMEKRHGRDRSRSGSAGKARWARRA
jgi:hypothetical protein